MIHLRSLELRPLPEAGGFPFDLPILGNLQALAFETPVTLFVGENGSGKSTLLEALACAAEMVVVGSAGTRRDPTLEHARKLASYLKLAWSKRTRRGFFLRAEDFFGYVQRLEAMRSGMETDLAEIDQEYQARSEYARSLARMSTAGQLSEQRRLFGDGLEARSHGESFLALFQVRFVPDGLYLLDEPEAPLSPLRQLALISAIKQMVTQNGQFVIATHSPILMAYPGATIYNFTQGGIQREEYDELEHIQLLRDFLRDPEAYLRNL